MCDGIDGVGVTKKIQVTSYHPASVGVPLIILNIVVRKITRHAHLVLFYVGKGDVATLEKHRWNLRGGWPQKFDRDPHLSLPKNRKATTTTSSHRRT